MSQHNGFIYVATIDKKFLSSAVMSAMTLKDYWPDAHVTLYTHEEWVDNTLEDIFDNVITKDVPHHHRAKLWALDKTPYDLTVYLDADTEIMSSDISTVFDQMTDADIMMTKIRKYAGAFVDFPGGSLIDHCGMFMYRSDPHVIEFMQEWWELYQEQIDGTWQWDISLYPEDLRPWDQWAFWWLMNKTDYKLNREYFEDDARWNFVNTYHSDEVEKEIVIYHHTLG